MTTVKKTEEEKQDFTPVVVALEDASVHVITPQDEEFEAVNRDGEKIPVKFHETKTIRRGEYLDAADIVDAMRKEIEDGDVEILRFVTTPEDLVAAQREADDRAAGKVYDASEVYVVPDPKKGGGQVAGLG